MQGTGHVYPSACIKPNHRTRYLVLVAVSCASAFSTDSSAHVSSCASAFTTDSSADVSSCASAFTTDSSAHVSSCADVVT